ncbi:MAG: acyltransferase [Anaerolineales bacterium]|nr:acyltransferase [Anaerolineales bacterium]
MELIRNIFAVLNAYWFFRNAELGKKVRLWGRPEISNLGRLIIGERVRLNSKVAKLELATGFDGTLKIGAGTFINYGTSIGAMQHIEIGKDCNIGTYCILMDNDFHRLEPERRQEMPESKPIVLEDNVWLGARVIVLRGVTIGAGSVVGANSIVTKNVPPRCLAVGMPAKVVRAL